MLSATIPPDALKVDNERTIAVNVIKTVNVLIVEGGETGTVADRDGYFLANALVPVSMDKSLRYYLGLTFAKPAGAGTTRCWPKRISCFLCNTAALTVPASKALSDYVQAGGKLVVFSGAAERSRGLAVVGGFLEPAAGRTGAAPDRERRDIRREPGKAPILSIRSRRCGTTRPRAVWARCAL